MLEASRESARFYVSISQSGVEMKLQHTIAVNLDKTSICHNHSIYPAK